MSTPSHADGMPNRLPNGPDHNPEQSDPSGHPRSGPCRARKSAAPAANHNKPIAVGCRHGMDAGLRKVGDMTETAVERRPAGHGERFPQAVETQHPPKVPLKYGIYLNYQFFLEDNPWFDQKSLPRRHSSFLSLGDSTLELLKSRPHGP